MIDICNTFFNQQALGIIQKPSFFETGFRSFIQLFQKTKEKTIRLVVTLYIE